MTLEFSAFEQVPAGAAIYLVDRDLERLINLREGSTYGFFLGKKDIVETEEEARFVLLVGSEEFVGEHEEELPMPPATTVLHQNYPNPFNPATVIRYEIANAGDVTICVYDVKGSLVRVLEKRYCETGRYEVGWNGENERGSKVTSGIYFYRLNTVHETQTRKMILLR